MRLEKSEYMDTELKEMGGTNKFYTFGSNYEQPEFGIHLMWNEPKRLWKPALVINLWRYSLQIGWLWDFPPEDNSDT